jgi:uncharacterized iron-regulated membrane protein
VIALLALPWWSELMNDSADLQSGSRVYARLWRWHFFAALIVMPFVLWQAATGVLYLWHGEIANLVYPRLVSVPAANARVSYDAQLATVLAHESPERLQAIEISDDPRRSTAFFFRDDNGLPYPAFVDPHRGNYLGHIESTHWIRGLSRGLHGGWPIQPWGSYLLELGASWAIVMTLTGVFLWWPRNARGLAGVLYPRLRSGSRTFWRDLHATVGIWFALVLLAFLVSALPWTTLWGGKVLGAVQRVAHQESPTGFFFAGGSDQHHAVAPATVAPDHSNALVIAARDHAAMTPKTMPAPSRLGLDDLVQKARAAGARGDLELQPALHGGPVNIRDDHARAWDEVWLQLDGQSGAVLTRVVWSDFPFIPKFVSLGIDLHEGNFFGRANQIFNTIFAASLVWLSVTGFIGWYKRRPAGSFGEPPKRAVKFPRVVIVTVIALCTVLPLLGASVITIAMLDRLFGRVLPDAA